MKKSQLRMYELLKNMFPEYEFVFTHESRKIIGDKKAYINKRLSGRKIFLVGTYEVLLDDIEDVLREISRLQLPNDALFNAVYHTIRDIEIIRVAKKRELDRFLQEYKKDVLSWNPLYKGYRIMKKMILATFGIGDKKLIELINRVMNYGLQERVYALIALYFYLFYSKEDKESGRGRDLFTLKIQAILPELGLCGIAVYRFVKRLKKSEVTELIRIVHAPKKYIPKEPRGYVISELSELKAEEASEYYDYEVPQYKVRKPKIVRKVLKLLRKHALRAWFGDPLSNLLIESSIINAYIKGYVLDDIPLISHETAIVSAKKRKLLLAIIDLSSSMSDYVEEIQDALYTTVVVARPEKIAIIGFDYNAYWVVRPTKNIIHALNRISGIFAGGTTYILPALKLLKKHRDLLYEAQGEVVIVTDGEVFDLNTITYSNVTGIKRVYIYKPFFYKRRFSDKLRELGIDVVEFPL